MSIPEIRQNIFSTTLNINTLIVKNTNANIIAENYSKLRGLEKPRSANFVYKQAKSAVDGIERLPILTNFAFWILSVATHYPNYALLTLNSVLTLVKQFIALPESKKMSFLNRDNWRRRILDKLGRFPGLLVFGDWQEVEIERFELSELLSAQVA